MKTLFRWALLIALPVALGFTGEVSAAQSPFKVTIAADKPVVKVGSQVIVNVKLTNTSKHDIDCDVAYNDMLVMDTFDNYDIRYDGVHLVEKKKIQHPELAGRSLQPPCTLKPGESKVIGADAISVAYNLSRPGQYVIQMSRAVSNNARDGVVKSNKITVTVTE